MQITVNSNSVLLVCYSEPWNQHGLLRGPVSYCSYIGQNFASFKRNSSLDIGPISIVGSVTLSRFASPRNSLLSSNGWENDLDRTTKTTASYWVFYVPSIYTI